MGTTVSPPTWVFDALPPSGARRGGDPSEHVFKHELDTFVREVVQNANDQRVTNPSVDFSVDELSGPEFQAFWGALDLGTLEQHLEAAGRTRGGRRIRERLREVKRTERLRVLRVEDRCTAGLTGSEQEGDSHFRALCKDVLFSHKRIPTAGGSYGLGKSVLWTFSGLSTVIFNSIPQELPAGCKPPRLIGRAELPSHRAEETEFAGPGWFGARVESPRGARADSVWSLQAAQCARELGIERRQLDSGTSILVLDFREPAADEDASVEQLRARIQQAAAEWFWPAQLLEGRKLSVSLQDGPPVDPAALPGIAPFVRCYQARRTQRQRLEEAGDIVVRDLEIELPPQRGQRTPTVGKVRLIVSLAAEGASDRRVGQVAMFRGAGMVVRYWDRTTLATRNQPFHAVLACGEARDPGAVTDADRMVEAFLRDAEPPGHDDWESTPALKEGWQRGYAKALEQLKDRANQALKELLAPAVTYGSAGPDLLKKRFPFGVRGSPGGAPSAFHFSDLQAQLTQGAWHFQGALACARGKGSWEATIRLREVGEDGAVLAELPVAHLTSGRPHAQVSVRDGIAHVAVERGNEPVHFSGQSAQLERPEQAGMLSLEVTGSRG